jgi:hypothetical protein
MKWLETGYAKRSFSLRLFMNWDVPWLKVVWRDPRYLELKRKIVATTAK